MVDRGGAGTPRFVTGNMFAGRRRWWWVAGAALVVAAVITWMLWPSPAPQPDQPPRARQYIEFTACLLTGEGGLADPAARPVWAGLQRASLTTRAKVRYLAIAGPQTVDNGLAFVANVAQTGCDLIFAAGPLAVASVEAGAPRFPAARFFTVAGSPGVANVTPIDASTADGVGAAVSGIVVAAVNAVP